MKFIKKNLLHLRSTTTYNVQKIFSHVFFTNINDRFTGVPFNESSIVITYDAKRTVNKQIKQCFVTFKLIKLTILLNLHRYFGTM
jgi:hypothetical protein